MSDFHIVIPARHASSRLPGKPLLEIAGKPMLLHVVDRARECGAASITVATDDERIYDRMVDAHIHVIMTSSGHASGTDRLAEVVSRMGWQENEIVVNLQGDEPLMPPALLVQCAALLDDGDADIGTLASPLAADGEIDNPNVVKVITDARDRAIYFSRAAVPYSR